MVTTTPGAITVAESNSIAPPRPGKPHKPKKPYPNFPHFPHATKRSAKMILGRMYYFGSWDDPDAALAKYQEKREDLYAGRTPRTKAARRRSVSS
jgi:hypothetical protein